MDNGNRMGQQERRRRAGEKRGTRMKVRME